METKTIEKMGVTVLREMFIKPIDLFQSRHPVLEKNAFEITVKKGDFLFRKARIFPIVHTTGGVVNTNFFVELFYDDILIDRILDVNVLPNAETHLISNTFDVCALDKFSMRFENRGKGKLEIRSLKIMCAVPENLY